MKTISLMNGYKYRPIEIVENLAIFSPNSDGFLDSWIK